MESSRERALASGSFSKNRFVNLLFVNAELKQTTFKKTIALYIFMAVLFIAVSIVLFIVLNQIKEYKVKYYTPFDPNMCPSSAKTGETCKIGIEVREDMVGEVYLMYQVGNFYQNHRRYLQSKSNYQLAGNEITDSKDAEVCKPYVTNSDMDQNQSWQGIPLNPNEIASPCGAIAKTFFNDTYALKRENGSYVTILETGISWPGDQGYKYKQGPDSASKQWINPEDEHFIVWMRTSGLPNFRKLWGRIEGGLRADNYTLEIENNYNSGEWEGNREVILTTSTLFGGKNLVMPIAFLILGVGCLIASIFFIRKWQSSKNHVE